MRGRACAGAASVPALVTLALRQPNVASLAAPSVAAAFDASMLVRHDRSSLRRRLSLFKILLLLTFASSFGDIVSAIAGSIAICAMGIDNLLSQWKSATPPSGTSFPWLTVSSGSRCQQTARAVGVLTRPKPRKTSGMWELPLRYWAKTTMIGLVSHSLEAGARVLHGSQVSQPAPLAPEVDDSPRVSSSLQFDQFRSTARQRPNLIGHLGMGQH